uniref:Uncharacterized protein n=1 Tax=Phage sp. ctGns7 TaxID=2828003 RepID=A0A8S5S919_9VIRU|nr:MAG TPA: hypothetical protein [Phage sp. ctGns7]
MLLFFFVCLLLSFATTLSNTLLCIINKNTRINFKSRYKAL